jgi:uncharacterized protein (DUF983 family)
MNKTKWELKRTFDNGYYKVREVRCPKCGHCETFIGVVSEKCYVCDERRDGL